MLSILFSVISAESAAEAPAPVPVVITVPSAHELSDISSQLAMAERHYSDCDPGQVAQAPLQMALEIARLDWFEASKNKDAKAVETLRQRVLTLQKSIDAIPTKDEICENWRVTKYRYWYKLNEAGNDLTEKASAHDANPSSETSEAALAAQEHYDWLNGLFDCDYDLLQWHLTTAQNESKAHHAAKAKIQTEVNFLKTFKECHAHPSFCQVAYIDRATNKTLASPSGSKSSIKLSAGKATTSNAAVVAIKKATATVVDALAGAPPDLVKAFDLFTLYASQKADSEIPPIEKKIAEAGVVSSKWSRKLANMGGRPGKACPSWKLEANQEEMGVGAK